MADPAKRPFEGWRVRERPAAIAGAAFACLLLTLVVAGSLIYDRTLRDVTKTPSREFPEPQLERQSLAPRATDGRREGDAAADPAIERAMRAVAGEGRP